MRFVLDRIADPDRTHQDNKRIDIIFCADEDRSRTHAFKPRQRQRPDEQCDKQPQHAFSITKKRKHTCAITQQKSYNQNYPEQIFTHRDDLRSKPTHAKSQKRVYQMIPYYQQQKTEKYLHAHSIDIAEMKTFTMDFYNTDLCE
jgi:hypothetical protein